MSRSEKINYLRISVTDRCNSRCIYCMPEEGIITRPHEEIMSFEEISRLAKIFVSLGISKIRLTGGEPLVRKGILNLVSSLADIKGVEELCLTTNGSLLHFYAEELKRRGIKSINISLDTLRENRFDRITRRGFFSGVLKSIDKAKALGFYPLKLNVVVMKGLNDDEIEDFIDFASDKDIAVRFIEFMRITPLWRKDYFIPVEEIKDICKRKFTLEKSGYKSLGPAEYYQYRNVLIGFIKTSEENCRYCSRLRLTSTGELKLCLYQDKGIPLNGMLRNGVSDNVIKDMIASKLFMKSGRDYRDYEPVKCYMSNIGG